ncbi:MAG: hypothetical protein IJC48_00495 [Clostridia bacterium]|nr:hypothetical protein [Clostridia bacterium]
MKKVCTSFSKPVSGMKPLHGVNNSPDTYGEPIPAFMDAGIPYVRLHDSMGAFGGTCFVDVPNIFPDFDADENDPASYKFEFTDAYLKGLTASGCKIFYRLGVTIENHYQIKRVHTDVPPDFEKWARICAHIVMHYNEGWANGFHMGIEYWEIWNEPENPPMWAGSMQDYFKMYEVSANYLKKLFPNLKVGGYASCGFYCTTRENMSEFYESFMTWFDEFLSYMQDKAPVDFFSWHLYTEDPREIEAHQRYVSDKLYEYGYHDTESIFNEWNYINSKPTRFEDLKEEAGAAFVGAAFSVMQYGSVDKAMYYDAAPSRAYCGLFYFPSLRVTKTYYAFKAYNELFRLGSCVKAVSDDETLYPIAAMNDNEKAVMLSSFGSTDGRVELDISGLSGENEIEVFRLNKDCNLEKDKVEYASGDRIRLFIHMTDNEVVLIMIKPMDKA